MEKKMVQNPGDPNFGQLDLEQLFSKLDELRVTPYGKPHIENLTVMHNRALIEERLQEITEMVGLIQGGHQIPLGQMEDIRPLLDRLKPQDSFLEPLEIHQIRLNLQAFSDITHFFLAHAQTCPGLKKYAARIHHHRQLIKEIDGSIDNRGELREDASPELRRIRREMGHLENEKKMLLMRVIKRYAEFTQDDIVTLRDGRMVLGIQQNFAGQVNGIVHGTSATGATLFIEPMETLRTSNEIQNLKIEERKEIIRILQFLSGLIREIRDDIFFAIENTGMLDFIFAKARLSVLMEAAHPLVSEKPVLHLQNARHPLLLLKMGHQNVVPGSLSLGDRYSTLVITGPNAGGKTVILKTVGLLVLMTQLGMHIPAAPDSVLPVLDLVLVDIGDRQSLEQDLSTFSAHILRLREILQQANTHSLVLVDEIGTGTDPREGAALAISFLRELTERKALTIATTHHGELKAFAYDTAGVENASMEFNLETLQPTYRLQVGIPGSSYAFEIARRYDFPEAVLKRAEEMLGPDKGQLENLILNLNARLQKIEEERGRLSIRLSEAEGLRNLYQSRAEKLKQESAELKRAAAEEAQRIVEQANARIEKAVADIRQSQARKEQIRAAHQAVGELKTSVSRLLSENQPVKPDPHPFKKGDIVWSKTLREEGEVLEAVDDQGRVWVLIGAVRMQLPAAELEPTGKTDTDSRVVFKNRNGIPEELEAGMKPELDLRGMDSYEAVEATDRYLDRVMQENWEEVHIIHGKGTGVLRKKINQFLAKDKRVAEKRLGRWGEGDTGVTIVKLRR